MWRTVIVSNDVMRRDITWRHQTETVVVRRSYLCNQAVINYDAELTKYTMKKWRLAFGSLRRTVGGQWWLDFRQPSSDRDAEPGRLLRNWGDFQRKKSSTSIVPPPQLTTKHTLGLQFLSAPIHPVQLFNLLHTDSAADSQGLSRCCGWDQEDLK